MTRTAHTRRELLLEDAKRTGPESTASKTLKTCISLAGFEQAQAILALSDLTRPFLLYYKRLRNAWNVTILRFLPPPPR
jgi:hypothetical protein